MEDKEILNEIKFISDIDKEKQNKKSKNERSKKSIIKQKEKRKITKENNEKLENLSSNGDKNEPSKDLFINNISKKEKILVNKEIKLQKTYEKNNTSETELIRLQKVYNTILGIEKNEKFQNVDSNFVIKKKKNTTIDIKCYGTDDKIRKISEKYRTDSEKNEISKTYESSTNKIIIKSTEKKFFECSKEGKNKEQKSLVNYNSEETNSHKIEKKMIDKQKGIERDNNKLYENYYKNDFVENKYVLNNIKIQKRYINNNKNKYNKIYIIYFCLFIISKIFFSQNIKCDNDFASSYINLKIKGTGNIKILSDSYHGKSPDNITINNAISSTKNGIKKEYNFENSENNINNITLTWNESITSTSNMFRNCVNITEIDLSNFDASSVKDMSYMFYGCSSLTSLDLSNFNTSKVENMNRIFSNCEKLEYVNLKMAKINLNASNASFFGTHHPNLTICSENEEWSLIFNLPNAEYVNCINNISYYDIYETVDKMKCFKNNINVLDNRIYRLL